ncbi:AraC family transcriptional regulator [Saccharobesus litoralis]|uniref:AraC family transcriptional regulator n=1 Tax=Saccharobesus litoralis TaxID=2172099 RepID=UPI0019007B16|nr:AraC family transcriptional regulator [Saccharobesus litoralis]
MIKANASLTFITLLLLGILSMGNMSIANDNEPQQSQETAQEVENNKLKTADEPELATELEKIKQQVIQLNRDLFVLEEDLLFPASTQVSVFVSVDVGRFFKLDSVEVKINGKNVAGFLYTDRQRFALEQGGIQRLYQGNLKEGEHELTAIFTGVDADNRDAKRAAVYTFEKDDEAIMIELKLQDNSQDYRAEVVVDEWVL